MHRFVIVCVLLNMSVDVCVTGEQASQVKASPNTIHKGLGPGQQDKAGPFLATGIPPSRPHQGRCYIHLKIPPQFYFFACLFPPPDSLKKILNLSSVHYDMIVHLYKFVK